MSEGFESTTELMSEGLESTTGLMYEGFESTTGLMSEGLESTTGLMSEGLESTSCCLKVTFTPHCPCLSEETLNTLLPGVYVRGSERSHSGDKCVLSWTLHL